MGHRQVIGGVRNFDTARYRECGAAEINQNQPTNQLIFLTIS
jgi:hypothetical protein